MSKTPSLRHILYTRVQMEVVFYALILSGLVAIILILSLTRMERQQATAWSRAIPESVLPHLKMGDLGAVKDKLSLLVSTDLFTRLRIETSDRQTIAQFTSGATVLHRVVEVPIQDEHGRLWGYFIYQLNFWHMGRILLMALCVLAVGFPLVFLSLRKRLAHGIHSEFAPLQQFVAHIKRLSDKLSQDSHELRSEFERSLSVAPSAEEKDMIDVILRFIDSLESRDGKLVQLTQESARQRYLDELARTAAMVSHDIRSPLAALQMVHRNSPELPESTRILIRDAVARIQDIAHTLEQQRQANATLKKLHPSMGIRPELLSPLISSLVSEKRQQLKNFPSLYIGERLDKESFGAFCRINPSEFQRILSNLIDNSAEALMGKGHIRVYVLKDTGFWRITVSDNGPGIAPDVLKHLGNYGATFGKSKGSGLGLYHAKVNAESWGGRLEIHSTPQGTNVSLILPSEPASPWFASHIRIPQQSDVIILDDDPSIHDVWENLITQRQREQFKIRLHHFTRHQELGTWMRVHGSVRPRVYLFDHEMPLFPEGGLSLLEKMPHEPRRYLVTSHVADPVLRERCLRSGVQLLPKSLTLYVPIVLDAPEETIAPEALPPLSA